MIKSMPTYNTFEVIEIINESDDQELIILRDIIINQYHCYELVIAYEILRRIRQKLNGPCT